MEQSLLERLYVRGKLSAHEIALRLHCSDNKVNYWLARYGIPKRSISEAIYARSNPTGDPFKVKAPASAADSFLLGIGLGLYWGEGNKRNLTAVRVGNTDPDLIKIFVRFLEEMYGVEKRKFRFWLQVFSDMNPQAALRFWTRALDVPASKFGKITITPARSIGTYREKTKHGVVTVYVSNTKLRNLLVGEIEKLKTIR